MPSGRVNEILSFLEVMVGGGRVQRTRNYPHIRGGGAKNYGCSFSMEVVEVFEEKSIDRDGQDLHHFSDLDRRSWKKRSFI